VMYFLCRVRAVYGVSSYVLDGMLEDCTEP